MSSNKWMKTRLKLVCAIFAMVFAAVLYKSFALTVIERPYLKSKADAEITGHLELGAVRGEIFDANGERLAASLAVSSIYADASLIPPAEDDDAAADETDDLSKKGVETRATVALKLHEALNLDQDWIKSRLDTGKKFLYLKRQLSLEETEVVKALKLPGIGFKKEYRRAYPNGPLAANFLGFVGIDGQGLEGLELSLDQYLKAGQETVTVKQDRMGRFLVDKVDGELEQSRGASVVLTIDRRIQYITEKALAKAVTTYHAKSGMALVMNPRTGAVISAAVWPTYDPNDYKSADNASRRNRILTDPFEPGSTFKVFVVAAALEEAKVTPESVVFCENGKFRVANHTVKDTHEYGDLTISQVIKFSSNIGSLKIGAILGKDLLYNYLTRFSFGERTGLAHLPGEAAGVLRNPKQWHAIDEANIAFGQGVSVTTLQMVMAMSSLANDGLLMKPYIVDRVLDEDGRVIEQHEPQILRQVVSPLTARQVAAMLRMAVLKGGTATRADVVGYPVAGKTGTAQKVTRGGRGYTAGKYVASFLGFAPYHDPQLCVMVVLDEPSNGYYGGTVATPAFKEIMENALPLLDIPPTEGKGDPVWPVIQKNSGGAPGVINEDQPTNFIRVRLKKNDRRAREPITAMAVVKESLASNEKDSEVVDPSKMPDLRGKTMREVLDKMGDYGLDLEFAGSGRVVDQNPPAGTAVVYGQSGTIVFAR